jgi:hypothetical protein
MINKLLELFYRFGDNISGAGYFFNDIGYKEQKLKLPGNWNIITPINKTKIDWRKVWGRVPSNVSMKNRVLIQSLVEKVLKGEL